MGDTAPRSLCLGGELLIPLRGATVRSPTVDQKQASTRRKLHSISTHSSTGWLTIFASVTATALWRSALNWSATMDHAHSAPDIGGLSTVAAKQLDPAKHLKIDVGWGYEGEDGKTMGGKGKLIERDYSDEERTAIHEGATAFGLSLEQALLQLGQKTSDVYLNDDAYWKNVPVRVWHFTIGGYQVMKKWPSYREAKLLGRVLSTDEAYYFRDMVRRITALCLLGPKLDANYIAAKANTYEWPPLIISARKHHLALALTPAGGSN